MALDLWDVVAVLLPPSVAIVAAVLISHSIERYRRERRAAAGSYRQDGAPA